MVEVDEESVVLCMLSNRFTVHSGDYRFQRLSFIFLNSRLTLAAYASSTMNFQVATCGGQRMNRK